MTVRDSVHLFSSKVLNCLPHLITNNTYFSLRPQIPEVFHSLLVLLTSSISCTKEKLLDRDWQNQLDNLTEEQLNTFNDRNAIAIGAAIGGFYDNLTKDGYQEFLNRVKTFRNIPQEKLSDITIKDVAVIFKINENSIIKYLTILQKHESYLINPDNRFNIVIGLYKYAELQASKVTRGVFSRIAKWSSVEKCGFWMHAARIADTSVSFYAAAAATDVALVSGGLATPLAVLAVGNAVDSYAGTVEYVAYCMK